MNFYLQAFPQVAPQCIEADAISHSNPLKAAGLFFEAGEKGCPAAFNDAGDAYSAAGYDYLARDSYTRAFAAGQTKLAEKLGDMALEGKGGDADPAFARACYSYSDRPAGRFKYARCLVEGSKEDAARARAILTDLSGRVKDYTWSTHKGLLQAQLLMAELCETGIGGPASAGEAKAYRDQAIREHKPEKVNAMRGSALVAIIPLSARSGNGVAPRQD